MKGLKVDNFVYHTAFFFIRLYLFLFRYKTTGKENIPREGNYIVVSNHASYMDPPLIYVSFYPTRLRYMGKASLFNVPFLNFFIKSVGTFPASKGKFSRQAIEKSIEILKTGKRLVIFPQGTRVKPGENEHFYDGAAYIAYKTNSPILPLALIGHEKVVPKGKKFPRFVKLKVNIGELFYPEITDKKQIPELTVRIRNEIEKLKSEV